MLSDMKWKHQCMISQPLVQVHCIGTINQNLVVHKDHHASLNSWHIIQHCHIYDMNRMKSVIFTPVTTDQQCLIQQQQKFYWHINAYKILIGAVYAKATQTINPLSNIFTMHWQEFGPDLCGLYYLFFILEENLWYNINYLLAPLSWKSECKTNQENISVTGPGLIISHITDKLGKHTFKYCL